MKKNFEGLYTFQEVSKIYNVDASTLRKMVQANKFSNNDIKKFGKTWIITEDAISKFFGLQTLRAYQREEQLLELKNLREAKVNAILDKKKSAIKVKKTNSDTKDLCSNDDEIKPLSYIEVDPSLVKQNFQF